MEEYLNIIEETLEQGHYKQNRTDSDTIASFSHHYKTDLGDGYPLITTKKMSDYRWNSMIYEFIWYLDAEHHIKNLKEHTKIWNAWADEDDNLPTAYGRFWRRYPLPDPDAMLEGEWWVNHPNFPETAAEHYGLDEEEITEVLDRWVNEDNGGKTFDQIQYVMDTLNGDNPMRGPESRRLVVSAWDPGNAAVSHLPPCHYTFVLNVQNGKLNAHLTQRSADVALGVPFNIAAYALLANVIAQRTGYEVGEFGHTLVDTHLYCGKSDRGQWYNDNLDELQQRVEDASTPEEYLEIRDWLVSETPDDEGAEEVENHEYGYDHIPGLLEQLSREPKERPEIKIADKPLDELEADDIEVVGYESHGPLNFSVAE